MHFLWEILQEILWEILWEIFKICKSSAVNAVGNAVGNSVGNIVGNAAGNAVGNLAGNGLENDAVFSLNMWLRTIYFLQTIHESACVILTLLQFFDFSDLKCVQTKLNYINKFKLY